MTNREAVKGMIGFPIPDSVLDARAGLVGIDLNIEYNPRDSKIIARFSANLLLYVAQSPESIREIDWQITNRSVDDLMKLRKYILADNGIVDTLLQPKINSKAWW